MKFKSKILHVDGFGGLSVGILLLLFSNRLTELYSLPNKTVIIIGLTNLFYGTYSASLAVRKTRPVEAIIFLVFANYTWTMVCVLLSILYWETISIFGLLHILGEGAYVSWLAKLEWKWRKSLQNSL